jgi:outer membrane immunogenic protein
MCRFHCAVLAAIAVFGFSSVASAADLPTKAPAYKAPVAVPYNWTGWYVGGNIGYGWGRDTGGLWDSTDSLSYVNYFKAGGNVLPGVKPNGIIGGGQVGYNWQISPVWVLGLVADIQASDMHGTASATVAPPGFATSIQSNSSKIDWFGTVRGRVGYAANNWLFYGTGGLAYGSVNSALTLNCVGCGNFAVYAGSNSAINIGWAAGAGVEVGLTPNWTVGVEYLHIDLGNISTSAIQVSGLTVFPATFTANSNFAADIVRGTVNFKF